MKHHIHKSRAHVNSFPLFYTLLSIAAILITLNFLVHSYRDQISSYVVNKTGNDALIPFLYADKMNDPEFTFNLGNFYFGSGAYNLAKAEKYYLETIRLDQKFERAHYQLARVYFVQGEFTKARQAINEEIKLYPDYGRSFYVRGLVNGYSGNLLGAIQDFKKFLEWRPNSWAGHNDLAWIYFQRGDFMNAYLTAEEGLQYSPENPWLLNTMGIALKNGGNKEEAKKALEQALASTQKLNPSDWGQAYPGNDPEFYTKGLDAMRKTIQQNLTLLDK